MNYEIVHTCIVKKELLKSDARYNWFWFESQPAVMKGKGTKMYCMSALVELTNTNADRKHRRELLKTQKFKISELTAILA